MKTLTTPLKHGSWAGQILKILWTGFKLFWVFMGCGYIFYLKMFYPFHMIIIFSILLFFLIHSVVVFFFPQASRPRILSGLTLSIVMLSAGYGCFFSSRANSADLIVPDARAPGTPLLEQIFKSTTAPVYEFVIQKMADIKLRDMEFQVSQSQVQQVKSMLEPGDIILSRKNNYISNWVVKGFWKHAALYCGSVDEMEHYFVDESKTVLNSTLKEHLAGQCRPAYEGFVSTIVFQEGAVIESTSKGVHLQAVDKALQSDYLAVLRPRISKKNKLSAILYSLEQLKKPYDFYLDFTSDDAFCCSELIYKAFYPHERYDLYAVNERSQISPNCMINGRPMVSPNDFVKDFDQSYADEDRQYDFICFCSKEIGANDCLEKTIGLFRTSWKKKIGI